MPIADPSKIDFQVVVEGTYLAVGGQAQSTANVLAYKRTLFTSDYDGSQFLTAFETAVKGDWLDAVSASWTMDTIKIRCLNDAEDAFVELAVGDPGTVTGQPLPSFAAMVISKRSAIRGRWANGRMFIAGVPESGCIGNALESANLTLLGAVATALSGTITTSGGLTYVPSVFSQAYSQIQENPTTVFNTQLASLTAQSILGTCGSRKSRVN